MRDLASFRAYQVFLNYPFDPQFQPMANGFNFAVVAAGLLPVCALDLTTPDRPRMDMLIEAIAACSYSAHDLSRATGEGPENFSRMNMPIEMGMALYPALASQRENHRCAFFTPTAHDYRRFASDLAGLDAQHHENIPERVVTLMYDWLRRVVQPTIFNNRATVEVAQKFQVFLARAAEFEGSGTRGELNHAELREVMYEVCAECEWWDWRRSKHGMVSFPQLPLARRQGN
jgi:hypothetical protein